jgi:hypothetical protein
MRISIFLAGALASVLSAPALGQEPSCMHRPEFAKWRDANRDVYDQAMSLLTCSNAGDESACNVLVGRAASELYKIDDFKNPDGSFLMANDILAKIKSTPGWTRLMPADPQEPLDQALLDDAAAGAQDHMIIAVRPADGNGHVALVLPGITQPSGNWNLNVPNSAAAFLHHPEQAYVFCALSYAFSETDGLEFWWKVKPR